VLADECYVVLHEVRLRGLVEVSGELDGSPHVAALLDAGLVAQARTSLRITAEGREAHSEWALLAAGSDEQQAAQRGYERFLPLNREFLRLCHDWQVRPGEVPNDHSDARYDWEILDRLHAFDERAAVVVRRIGRDVPRFEPYQPRLRAALARVGEGEHEWFTSPRIDSYHTVWMHVHEDLLLALGRDRADEPPT
jgi:hypothetical protein